MKQTTCKVNGETWTCKVVTARELKKIADQKGLAGLCVYGDKAIYIDQDSVNYDVIAHELHHAYFFDLHLDDTENIDIADIREIMAELFAVKGARMLRQAKRITKELQP